MKGAYLKYVTEESLELSLKYRRPETVSNVLSFNLTHRSMPEVKSI